MLWINSTFLSQILHLGVNLHLVKKKKKKEKERKEKKKKRKTWSERPMTMRLKVFGTD